ncbi:hypothetical protein [Flavivirga jejuensis]|uniref:Lipocalin-like domain-containing protein n=1 Tax=Flavivirga jejuensis TaxID=870487 RepID=A0ABT8WT20_9FLAO|nr:hypothetical protein [Flavivirga jejuensis]MDO5976002.1 hypothetical protein [Flavivirga jejuensis]
MKPHHYIFILLITIFNIPQTVSAQITLEQLIGTWTFDYQASINNMSQKSKAHYAQMDIALQSKISTRYKNRKVTFNDDGSYVQVLTGGKNTTAAWAINKDNNLEITALNEKTILFKIKKLERNTLILSQIKPKDSNVNVLFTHWYLTKN